VKALNRRGAATFARLRNNRVPVQKQDTASKSQAKATLDNWNVNANMINPTTTRVSAGRK